MSLLKRLVEFGKSHKHFVKSKYGDIWCIPDIREIAESADTDAHSLSDAVAGCATIALNNYMIHGTKSCHGIADVEIKDIQHNKRHHGNNKTFFYEVGVKEKRYRFFVKTFNDESSRDADLQVIDLLKGAGVAMLPRPEGLRTVIYDMADGSLEDRLSQLKRDDVEGRRLLLHHAIDSLFKFYASSSTKKSVDALKGHGVKEKDLGEDIDLFFRHTSAGSIRDEHETIDTDFQGSAVYKKLKKVLYDRIKKERLEGVKPEKRLIHGDFHGGNLIVKDSNILVHDFEKIAFGQVEYDLASLLTGLDVSCDMKEEMIDYAYTKMQKRASDSNGKSKAEFKSKVNAARIIRGLMTIGWAYKNYENLTTEGGKKSTKQLQKVKVFLENILGDVLFSAKYHDTQFGDDKNNNPTYNAILDYAKLCLDRRIDVDGVNELVQKEYAALMEKKDVPVKAVPAESQVTLVGQIYNHRKPLGIVAAAIITGGLIAYGVSQCNHSGPNTPVPKRKQVPAPRGAQEPAPQPAPQPAPKPVRKCPPNAPPGSQNPGTADGRDPDFCRSDLVNYKGCCEPRRLRPYCGDKGHTYNRYSNVCENPRGMRVGRPPSPSCEFPEYVLVRDGNKFYCYNPKAVRR